MTNQKKRFKPNAVLALMVALVICLAIVPAGCAPAETDPKETEAPADPTQDQTAADIDPTQYPENSEYVDDEAFPLENLDESELVTVQDNDLSINKDLPSDWVNILLLGGDSRSMSGNSRTDAMMIFSYNVTTRRCKLTSIMRDTLVSIPGKASKNKINAANVFGGPKLAMKTVNEAFGLNISSYASINMAGISQIIDAVGGIELDVSSAERDQLNKYMKDYSIEWAAMSESERDNNADFTPLGEYGENIHVSGQQALAYARLRHLGHGDYDRVSRQRTVLIKVAKKLQDSGLAKCLTLIPDAMNLVNTNLSLGDAIQLGTVLIDFSLDDFEEMRLPVDGTFRDGTVDGMWSIRPDFEQNTQLLHEFIYGGGEAAVAGAADDVPSDDAA